MIIELLEIVNNIIPSIIVMLQVDFSTSPISVTGDISDKSYTFSTQRDENNAIQYNIRSLNQTNHEHSNIGIPMTVSIMNRGHNFIEGTLTCKKVTNMISFVEHSTITETAIIKMEKAYTDNPSFLFIDATSTLHADTLLIGFDYVIHFNKDNFDAQIKHNTDIPESVINLLSKYI